MTGFTNPIEWFRHTSPYIRAHRGRTFVIYLGNGALESPQFANVINDLALMHLLGIRLVLVHATRGQVEQALDALGIESQLHRGVRVTDNDVLGVVKDVVATQRLQLESQLSLGLPDSPMRGSRLRVVSGNFVTARPLGVVDGVDFQFTGAVRRLDAAGMTVALDNQGILLLSPLGFSPTGEVFNLSADEVATASAIALGADKLIFLDRADGLADQEGQMIRQCRVAQARALMLEDPVQAAHRDAACLACEQGVQRSHLLSYERDGALIEELYTHDGAGTLISNEDYERHRAASVDDVAGVLELIQPLEDAGVLVRRSRERLEQELGNFTVLERDGRIVACAALYPFAEERMAEVACIAIHSDYRNGGRGSRLLGLLAREASTKGIERLFVLTTQTTHWFREQGFVEAGLDALPKERQALYNLQRNSKVLIRHLD